VSYSGFLLNFSLQLKRAALFLCRFLQHNQRTNSPRMGLGGLQFLQFSFSPSFAQQRSKATMSTDEPSTANEFGIIPYKLYRKSLKTTREILGLGPTQINAEIENKTLPPPVSLTKDGKAKGWYGYVLIELVKERQKQALERAPPKPKADEVSTPSRPRSRLSEAPPKSTKPKKRRLRR
jgi:hypothetical protein